MRAFSPVTSLKLMLYLRINERGQTLHSLWRGISPAVELGKSLQKT